MAGDLKDDILGMEDFTQEPDMQFNNQPKNNSKLVVLVVIVLLVIIGIVFLVVNRGGNKNSETSGQTTEQNNSDSSDKDDALRNSSKVEEPGQLRGVLLKSDNEKLGNLLLVRLGGDIYLSTSRNFDHLLNQEVVVEIDGDLKKFKLVTIELD